MKRDPDAPDYNRSDAYLGHQLLPDRQLHAPPFFHESVPSPQAVQKDDFLSIPFLVLEVPGRVGRDVSERGRKRVKQISGERLPVEGYGRRCWGKPSLDGETERQEWVNHELTRFEGILDERW
jgi:hypothetical protein